MNTKFYVDASGNYLGGFKGALPPAGAIEVPFAPESASNVWNGVSFTKPLSEVKAAKLAQLEQARDAETFKDVTALGSTWQADERSQKLLSAAITLASAGAPLPTVWRDTANNDLQVTSLGQLVTIAGAMAAQTQAAYAKSWTLKAQVNAATTSAEVDAVVW